MSEQNIYICTGRWCHELGAKRIYKKVKQFFKKDTTVSVEQCRCLGYCEEGVNVMKQGKLYHNITEDNAIEQLTRTAGKKREMVDSDVSDTFLGDL
jgi:NADH:ubiquinone oxidoreductase subunit E